MNLILLGAPGAGKGTQAEILTAKLGIPAISPGNILRAAVKDGTEMGLKAKSYMDAGGLVPDDVIIGILKERLGPARLRQGLYPGRRAPHHRPGRGHREDGIRIDKVLDLAVDEDVIFDRMSGRRVCEACGASYHVHTKPSKVEGVCDACGGKLVIRKDDEPQTVRDRLKAYHAQTRTPDRVLPQPRQAGRGAKRGQRRGHDGGSHEGFGGVTALIQIKNAKELDGMRRGQRPERGRPQVWRRAHRGRHDRTWELDKLIYEFIIKHGGTPNFKGLYGFPGTACISLNDTVIHGIPSHDIVIRPGDIVSIDTGAKVDGFNGDNACTYPVGKIDLEAQRLVGCHQGSAAPGHRPGQGRQPDRGHQPGRPDILRGGGLLGGAGICGPRHRP